jgi:hypothetical protein
MKIREGAYYRTRGGDVVGPMRRTKDQSWYSGFHTWNEDGGMFLSGAEHGLDLISEVYVSDTPPADALRAENARLREAMEMARDCLEDKDVIGSKQTLTLALAEDKEAEHEAADLMAGRIANAIRALKGEGDD